MTTLDPALENRIAVEAPIPEEAPVIRAEVSVRADGGELETESKVDNLGDKEWAQVEIVSSR